MIKKWSSDKLIPETKVNDVGASFTNDFLMRAHFQNVFFCIHLYWFIVGPL